MEKIEDTVARLEKEVASLKAQLASLTAKSEKLAEDYNRHIAGLHMANK